MLKRPPTRIELKPDDRAELDEAHKRGGRGKQTPPSDKGAHHGKSAAERIGIRPQPPADSAQGTSPARFR